MMDYHGLIDALTNEGNPNAPEAFIVNPEFVEQAIREKLIADQRRDETDKLGEAIGNIAFYNGHNEWLRKIADEMSAIPEGKSYTYVFDEWHTERHTLWMMLVSAFGDWGASIRSGWIVNTKKCAEFINKATGRYESEVRCACLDFLKGSGDIQSVNT